MFSLDRTQFNNALFHDRGALLGIESGSLLNNVEIACAYLLALAHLIPPMARLGRRLAKQWPLLLLPLWACISVAWSQSPLKTIIRGSYVIVVTFLATYLLERFQRDRVIELLALVAAVTISMSAIAVAFIPNAGIDNNTNQTGAWEGIFVTKNNCGEGMTYLLLAIAYLRPRSILLKLGNYALAVAAAVFIVMAQSRTGWLLFGASVLFWLLIESTQRVRNANKLVLLAAGSGIATAVAYLVIMFAPELSTFMGKDATMTGRTGIWQAIVPFLWKQPLLGFGYGAFWLGLTRASGSLILSSGFVTLANAENAVLQIWLELGLIGVLFLFVSLSISCKNAIICLRDRPSTYVRWCVMVVFVTALALVDGDKIMAPHTLEWLLYVMAYISLAEEAKRVRTEKARASVAEELAGAPAC
jgi:O-antigen ligase